MVMLSVIGETKCLVEPSSNWGFVNVVELRDLLDCAEQEREGRVILDLTDVRVLDAVTISVIALAAERLGVKGRQLLVRGLTPHQQHKMRYLRLLFGISRSEVADRKRAARRSASVA
jgi:anti-anti-sigma regulatory factor